MRVNWQDLGKPTVPAQLKLGDYLLNVGQDAIDVWKRQPLARFTVILTEEMDGKYAALGTYELPR